MTYYNFTKKDFTPQQHPLLIEKITKTPSLLTQLLEDIKKQEDKRLMQSVSWMLGKLAEKQPALYNPHYSTFIWLLKPQNNKGNTFIIRNTLRTLSFIKSIPKKHEAIILNLAFDFFNNSSSAIALRVFSMEIIFNISDSYPEIRQELLQCIKKDLEFSSPSSAFKFRAKRIITAANYKKK